MARWIAALALCFAGACASQEDTVAQSTGEVQAREPLRVNQISVKGTHNSYHVAKLLAGSSVRYTHAPIAEQLEEQGIRSFEFDIHVEGDLAFRVFHTDGDRGTRCATLGACLGDIKRWSDSHRDHVPIFVMIEEKEIGVDAATHYDALDREILAVWPRERLLTPAAVRGGAATLREAIETKGWPMLDDARGKIGVFLTAMSAERKAAFRTRERLAFPTGWYGEPDVGVLVIDDPEADAETLARAVRDGYLVRTRADVSMEEVGDGDESRFRAALGGGAHFISTDQPEPGRILHRDYELKMPTARCNARSGPAWCNCLADFDVETMR